VLHGTLYAEVGLIVAAYMGGLALGASAANRLWQMANGGWLTANGRWRIADGERPPAGGETSMKLGKKVPGEVRREKRGTDRTAFLVVLGLAVAFACLIPLLLTHPGSLPAPAFWLMALIAGCLGGMVYPLAISTAQPGEEPRQDSVERTRRSAAAGRLYGADLLGGCMGALIGATILVPVLGIPQTCVMVAFAGLAAMIALA
jgi:hypothetical protein